MEAPQGVIPEEVDCIMKGGLMGGCSQDIINYIIGNNHEGPGGMTLPAEVKESLCKEMAKVGRAAFQKELEQQKQDADQEEIPPGTAMPEALRTYSKSSLDSKLAAGHAEQWHLATIWHRHALAECIHHEKAWLDVHELLSKRQEALGSSMQNVFQEFMSTGLNSQQDHEKLSNTKSSVEMVEEERCKIASGVGEKRAKLDHFVSSGLFDDICTDSGQTIGQIYVPDLPQGATPMEVTPDTPQEQTKDASASGNASMGGNDADNGADQADDDKPAQVPSKEELDKELQEYMDDGEPASTLPKEEEQDKDQGKSESSDLN